ncbi:MAG TPA: DinB family protein [Chloroflexota bacterium]|nr:DinB family protein [Chloroflexota bacterium]
MPDLIVDEWKAHYVARLHAERADLLWQLRGLSAETVGSAEVVPGWTVKDILAHIPFYDAAYAGRIQMVLHGRTAEITSLTDDSGLANRNANLLAQNRTIPYEQVIAMLLKERSGFTAVLKRVPDDLLSQDLPMPWGQNTSIREWANWRYEHDADHGRQLATWREYQPRETLRDVTPVYVLRAMLHSSRKAFQALLPLIPEPEWTTRPVCGVWTMKDLFGHLTDWEKVAVDGLRPLAAGQIPEFDYTLDSFDTFNNKNAAARAQQSWDEVWADYETTRATLLDLLAQTSSADLQRPFMAPWGREITGGVWLLIWPGHEMEHAIDVRAALALADWPPRFVKHG